MPAIVVEGLERAFGEGPVVQGIDLTVEEGEIYAFLGPNGAGKTTTVRMLTTLLLPTGGGASVAGHDVVKEARAVRGSIGVALQEAAPDPLMTERELIRLQATLQGIPTADGRRRADDTAYAPLALLSGWLQHIARVNPVTQVIEAARQGFVGSVSWAETWPGLLAIAGMLAILGALALREMRRTGA